MKNLRMKALTIRQPWAHLTATGDKLTENRTRVTHYRGEVAIHAAKQHDRYALTKTHLMAGRDLAGTRSLRLAILDAEDLGLVYGAVLAVADLVDCHAAAACTGCSPWAFNHGYHWQLANVRRLATPIPARGALGVWTLPYEVESAVRGQLAGLMTLPEMAKRFGNAMPGRTQLDAPASTAPTSKD